MPKIRTGTVRVEGLAELQRALKSMGPELVAEGKEAGRGVARFVTAEARSRALTVGGVAAKAAPSLKAVGTVRSAGTSFGGARYPFAMGAEFGAGHNVPRRRSTGIYAGYNQFNPWRGNGRMAGYFLYPTIRSNEQRIVEEYAVAVDRLLRRAFPG